MPITRKKHSFCPIEATLSAISARWKARIVWRLAESPASFTLLRSGISGISDRMLTAQLSELVSDGVVATAPMGEAGRYRLTPLGLELIPVLHIMQRWGEAVIDHRSHVVPAEKRAPGASLPRASLTD